MPRGKAEGKGTWHSRTVNSSFPVLNVAIHSCSILRLLHGLKVMACVYRNDVSHAEPREKSWQSHRHGRG